MLIDSPQDLRMEVAAGEKVTREEVLMFERLHEIVQLAGKGVSKSELPGLSKDFIEIPEGEAVIMGLMDGKKCLVMGVANKRSIAWGIAQSLHREGAQMAFSYQNERFRENGEELIEDFSDREQIPLLPCDVSVAGDVERLFTSLGQRWGKLDVLVHSLAFSRTEDLVGSFLDISREGYKLAHEISAYSLIECARYARPLMLEAGGGSMLTMSYLAAERVVAHYNVMATAKAALECNVRYLAAQMGPENIRVNAISAGPVKTLAASATKGVSTLKQIYEERSAMRKNITTEEIGDVGLFLASDLSRAITGATLYVDRGFSIMGVEYGKASDYGRS